MLEQDDYILLMSMPPIGSVRRITADGTPVSMDYVTLTVDQMREFNKVGVKTSYEFVQWSVAEPRRGEYDWKLTDLQVERSLQSGMKALLATPNNVPTWSPPEWLAAPAIKQEYAAWFNDHSFEFTDCAYLRLDNPEAQEYMLGFLQKMIDRYYTPGQVLVIGSHQKDGEGPMGAYPVAPRMEDVVSTWKAVGEVTVKQDGEIWCQIHRELGQYPGTGCQYATQVYEALSSIPGARLVGLNFTYFPFVDRAHPRVKADIERFRMPFYVGGEWSSGARANAPFAKQNGLRFITAPIHPYVNKPFSMGMVEDVAEAIRILKS